jgi:predicted lipid-binding transport protein (Tim44 family)
MNQAFDPLNILILAVAVIVLLRLRSVLGSRTGHEKRIDPFGTPNSSETAGKQEAEDNVIQLPGQRQEAAGPIWTGFAEEGSSLAKGLENINEADKSFEPGEFLQGAKIAYEMIVTAFSEGDKKGLKALLSKEVYSGFSSAIDERKAAGQKVETRFVGIDDASLVDAALSGRIASLTIRFVSQLISVTRDADDNVIDGDPKQINEVTDVWTFERDVTSRDPNWNLAATEANG